MFLINDWMGRDRNIYPAIALVRVSERMAETAERFH